MVMVSSVVLGQRSGRLLGLTWSLVTWHVALHSTRGTCPRTAHVYTCTATVQHTCTRVQLPTVCSKLQPAGGARGPAADQPLTASIHAQLPARVLVPCHVPRARTCAGDPGRRGRVVMIGN